MQQFHADRDKHLAELMTLVIADHTAGNDAPRTEAPELPHSLDEVIDTWFTGADNDKPSRMHSPEDVERIRREIDSAVYLLPWLAPVGTGWNRREYRRNDQG